MIFVRGRLSTVVLPYLAVPPNGRFVVDHGGGGFDSFQHVVRVVHLDLVVVDVGFNEGL